MDADADPHCDAVAAHSHAYCLFDADAFRYPHDDANAHTLADSNIYANADANTNAFPYAHDDAIPAPGGCRAG